MIVIRFLQFLFVLLVVRLLSLALGAFLRARRAPAGPAQTGSGPPKPAGGELVRDRVCNTHVPRKRALVARVGGEREYFCSESCRDRALAAWSRAS